jgi:DNA replication licensing factor MCM4
MRLSSVVTVQDVSEAVRLMKVSMQQSSIDPRTGQIDMDLIQTGGWVSGWVGGQGQCNL